MKRRRKSKKGRGTAQRVRRLLGSGRFDKALEIAGEHFATHPTDDQAKRLLIEVYRRQLEGQEMSSRERLTFLVQLLQFGVIEPWIWREYFELLEPTLAARRVERAERGQLVIGLGTGRSGSTSLARLLARAEGASMTHENPPILYWPPTTEQLDFHLRRFEVLSRYYPLVGDVAHWWLNGLEPLRTAFPEVCLLGVRRDTAATIESFERIKGRGRGAINHWQDHDGSYWVRNIWDPCYPSAEVDVQEGGHEAGRRLALRQYIEDYNERMQRDSAIWLFSLEELNDPRIVARLNDRLGTRMDYEKIEANKGGIQDSHWQGDF